MPSLRSGVRSLWSPKAGGLISPSRSKGFGSGVIELALRHRGDAFRVVYALRIDNDIWMIHAFQKKSKTGIKTPQAEIDLIHTPT